MKASKLFLCISLVVSLLLMCSSGLIAEDDWKTNLDKTTRDRLRGAIGAYVLVEDINPKLGKWGLTGDWTRTYTEMRLRVVGIRVLNRQEFLESASSPMLYVHISVTVSDEFPRCIYSLETQFAENATLVRKPKLLIDAILWRSGSYGLCPTETLKETIAKSLSEKLDEFINHYLAANPKDAPSEQTSK